MSNTIPQWTGMLQAFTRSVLRYNPHLLARPHQVWLLESRRNRETLQPISCYYAPPAHSLKGNAGAAGHDVTPPAHFHHPDPQVVLVEGVHQDQPV